MDFTIRNNKPICPYGKPISSICTSSNCRQPAIICQQGQKGNQCGIFHQSCSKLQWAKIQGIINHNPRVCCPDFHYLMDKVDQLILQSLQKIRNQHEKFHLWVRTYGYSLQVMKFIKDIGQNNYSNFKGNYLNPIVTQMLNTTRQQQLPTINEDDLLIIKDNLLMQIEKISNLYLKPQLKQKILPHITLQESQMVPSPKNNNKSKIVTDFTKIESFFTQPIKDIQLLYRASQKKFDIKEFHRSCDNKNNTLVLIQTQFGKVIGGYTPVAWSSNKKHWAADKQKHSFVFSLNTGEKYNLNLMQFAIANNPEKGPIFGCCDICIVDQANHNRCNAEFPISYNNNRYVRSPDTCFSFTGDPKGKFLTHQWEVFHVQFK